MRNAALVLAGVAVAGIPAAILFVIAPKAFGYGNILYPELNSLYRDVLRYWADNGLPAKLSFFVERLLAQPANLTLLLGTLSLGVLGLVARLRDAASRHAVFLLLLAATLLLLTAFAPTPAWYQYFFAYVPLAILTCAVVIARLHASGLRQAAFLVGAAVGGLGIALGTWDAQIARRLQSPTTWVPMQVHQLGLRLAREVRVGTVLTLGPVLAMEGGLSTYEAFATGPFTWRVAHIIPEANRRLVGWAGRDDLDAYLASCPPSAVLTGLETENDGFEPGQRGNLEAPLESYAQRGEYLRIPLQVSFIDGEITLWKAPGDPQACAP